MMKPEVKYSLRPGIYTFAAAIFLWNGLTTLAQALSWSQDRFANFEDSVWPALIRSGAVMLFVLGWRRPFSIEKLNIAPNPDTWQFIVLLVFFVVFGLILVLSPGIVLFLLATCFNFFGSGFYFSQAVAKEQKIMEA